MMNIFTRARCFLIYLFAMFLSAPFLRAQAPYIQSGSGDGLGQYGYLEKNAATFARLNRNTYSNIDWLAARWYVTDNNAGNGSGQEYVYYVYNGSEWGTGWQCNGNNDASKTTNNYSSSNFGSEWQSGADAYVSVWAKYCGGATSPSPLSGTGFNERHFKIIDYEPVSVAGSVNDGNGNCTSNNVVGSFTIDVGTATGLNLNRFFFSNSGVAQEGTNVPNDGFKLFYETYTGSESFDGTESSKQLYGDWGGDATNNNIYGADNLSIPLSGKIRFYVVICDLTSLPSTSSNAFNLNLLNDGMSLSPVIDGYGMVRINAESLGGSSPLPVSWLYFGGKTIDNKVLLEWKTTNEVNNSYFEVERSLNAKSYERIGRVYVLQAHTDEKNYTFEDNQPTFGINYYRLKQVDTDGKFSYSRIISTLVRANGEIKIFPNPTTDKINISGLEHNASINIVDTNGRVVWRQIGSNSPTLEIGLQGWKAGDYTVQVVEPLGNSSYKFSVR